MCGIAGYHIRKSGTAFDASRLAAELLLCIDHRGGDATGYAAFAYDGSVQIQKAACDARTFLTGCRTLPTDTRSVLLHTRLATQGKAAFPENNHPVSHGAIHVVHNGHIWNDKSLFGALGVRRMGYVDSEVIPALIAKTGWKDIGKALEQLDGSYALAIANEQKPGEIVLAKGDFSPLVYFANENLVVWASEAGALIRAWRAALGTPPQKNKLRELHDGDIVRLTDDAISLESFEPIIQYTYTYTQACTLPPYKETKAPKLIDPPSKMETALAVLDARQRGTVKVWSVNGWRDWQDIVPDENDPDAMSVKCGCCDTWTDALEMDEWAGEMLCPGCFDSVAEALQR